MTLIIEPVLTESSLLAVVTECEGVKTFRLSVPDAFTFLPGMFVLLHFEDAPKVSRAYSISSSPHEKGYVEVTLNKVGDFTQRLFALKRGDRIGLRGPYGKWLYTDDLARAALISGGTGITPFRSMARYALSKGLPNELSIFHCADAVSERLFQGELAEFSRRGIKVHSRADITVDLLRGKLRDFAATHFFLCGPDSLVEGLSRDLAAAGIPPGQVHREKWGDYSF